MFYVLTIGLEQKLIDMADTKAYEHNFIEQSLDLMFLFNLLFIDHLEDQNKKFLNHYTKIFNDLYKEFF